MQIPHRFLQQTVIFRDFPRANLGLVIGPYFFPKQRQNFPNLITNYPMSDFVLHFGENFMKIAPKLTKLWLIIFRFVKDFDEYF